MAGVSGKENGESSRYVPPIVPEGTPEDSPYWVQVFNLIHITRCTGPEQCTDPICAPTRQLIKHKMTCRLGKHCPVPNCWMFFKIFMHWCNCKSPKCADCTEISTKISYKQSHFFIQKQVLEQFSLMSLK